MDLKYVMGNATRPLGTGPRVIVHCCNDRGKWGAGFVLALSRRWPQVEGAYRRWHRTNTAGTSITTGSFSLGNVQFVEVEPQLWVANLIGQEGVGRIDGTPPIRYPAIEQGLKHVAEFATVNDATIHMPKMGSGLSGGDWSEIESIVKRAFQGLSVTVYVLPGAS